MVNKPKQRGTAWETQVVRWLQDNGFPYARRITLQGKNDIGDVWLGDEPPGGVVVIECKNLTSITLASIMDELKKEAKNASVRYGVAFIKRRNKGVGDAYVVTTGDMWVADRMRKE